MDENKSDKEFLLRLASLCEEYRATFSYTTADDGIHICVDNGREIFVGYMSGSVKELREACGAT